MRLLFGVVLLVGLGLAGFAVYMAQGYIGQYQAALAQERAERAKQIKLTEIYIADRVLSYGEQFTIEDVKKVKWPEETVPEGAFRTEADLFPEDGESYRTVVRAMEKFEPLLAVKVTEPGEDAGISSRLGKGKRAFTINVDVSSGVAGFLRPGERVDVYWTGTPGNSRDRRPITKLIETGVNVIAVDQTANEERYNPVIARTVTVSATQQQVAALLLAQSTGKLSLSLVGANDDSTNASIEINQNELLGIVEEEEVVAEVEPEAPKECVIRERKGSEIVETPIPCTN